MFGMMSIIVSLRKWIAVACLMMLAFHVSMSADTLSPPPVVDDEQYFKARWLKRQHLKQALSEYQLSANQQAFDVNYYRLDINIDPVNFLLVGRVDVAGGIVTAPLDTLELDLTDSLQVDSVTAGGGLLNFSHSDDLLRIVLPTAMQQDQFELAVYYQGTPPDLGFGSFAFSSANQKPAVFTLSEPFFARTWWPCKDHPSDKADSVDIIVTIDDRLVVASNGSLISINDNGDGTKTTHWHEQYPIVTYLVSLAIADYVVYADTFAYQGYEMPVDFFIFPNWVEKHRVNNAKVVEMLAAFSDLFGIYPFIEEKYGHAQFNSFGGAMEHQTCSSMGSFSEYVIAHELAHQWWGDMITLSSWHEIWLNEGFARYSEALWFEAKYGKQAYHDRINSLHGLDGMVYVEDTSEVYNIFSLTVYDKGAFVLHMLRYLVGDQTFFDILKTYAASAHQYSTARISDFQQIAEDVSGRDLAQFFTQWLYEAEKPEYHYSYHAVATDSGYLTFLYLNQTQQGYSPFQVDLDVRFHFADGDTTIRISNYLIEQDYSFLLSAQPTGCTIDPYNWLLNSAALVDYIFHVTNNKLPTALWGADYQVTLNAGGGIEPYCWTLESGELPAGLALDSNGVLGGTPTEYGCYPITVGVTEASAMNLSAERQYELRVEIIHGSYSGRFPIDLSDAVLLIRYLFRSGALPQPPANADADCDGNVDLVDIILVLNYLFATGPPPCSSLP